MPASDMAIAIACLRDLTSGPDLLPECNSPALYSFITLPTLACLADLVLGLVAMIYVLPFTLRSGDDRGLGHKCLQPRR